MRDARGVVVAARVLAQTEHRAHRRVERVAAQRGAGDGSFLGRFVDGPQRSRVPLDTRANVVAVVEDLLPLAEPLQAAQPLALPQSGGGGVRARVFRRRRSPVGFL